MAASFPIQNNHAREPTTNMLSAMATLSNHQRESELITLPISSDDWYRAFIIKPNGNGIHSFHEFEKIRQYVSASTISTSPSITCALPYDCNNMVIEDSGIIDTCSMIKMQSAAILSFRRNSLTVSTKENQAAVTNSRSSVYPWHKDLINTRVYLDHRLSVSDQHFVDMNPSSFISSNLYQISNAWQHYDAQVMNYQPLEFSNSLIQSIQGSGNTTEKLFSSKEAAVEWGLNELDQPVYAISGISMSDTTNSILKDESETNSRNNGHESNIYRSSMISRHSSEALVFQDLENSAVPESNKRERKTKQSEDQKRNNHLASERKRRANYKNALENLSKLIPRESGTESQSCLIWKAVNFIRSLKQTNNMLRLELQDLMGRH